MTKLERLLNLKDFVNSCKRKDPHGSRGAAEAHMRSLIRRDIANADTLEVYHCRYGNHYHVGNIK